MMNRRVSFELGIFQCVIFVLSSAASPQDSVVLLDDTADALIWMSRADGSISKTEALPNAGDGSFRAITLDEAGNVFVTQEVDASSEGRVVFYNEMDDSFQTLAQFTGYQPGYVEQTLIAEWPHSLTEAERITEIQCIVKDAGNGLIYGLDHDDDRGDDRVYEIDRDLVAPAGRGLESCGTC